MNDLKYFSKKFNVEGLTNYFMGIYLFVTVLTIYTSLNRDFRIVKDLEFLIVPILLVAYLLKTKKFNSIFIISLVFVWLSQLFLTSSSFAFIGLFFLLMYKVLILSYVKIPVYIQTRISSIPYVGVYLVLAYLSYNGIENAVFQFLTQGLFIIIFGGATLSNYIIKPNKSNAYLFISATLIIGSQFLEVLKTVYVSINLIQTVAFLLFAVGQFGLFQYINILERKTSNTNDRVLINTVAINSNAESKERFVKVINLDQKPLNLRQEQKQEKEQDLEDFFSI